MISDWLSVSLKDRYVLLRRGGGGRRVPGSFVGEGILLERPRIWFIYQRNWFSLPGVLFFSRFIAPPREEYHAPSWFPDENSKLSSGYLSSKGVAPIVKRDDKWWWPRAAPSNGTTISLPHPLLFSTDFFFTVLSNGFRVSCLLSRIPPLQKKNKK